MQNSTFTGNSQKPTSSKSSFGLGLSKKLRLIYGIGVVLIIAISILSWISFQNLASNQDTIIKKVLPTLETLQQITHSSTRIDAIVEQSHLSKNHPQLRQLKAQLSEELEALRSQISALSEQQFEARLAFEIGKRANILGNKLQHQIDQISVTMTLQQLVTKQRNQVLQSHDALLLFILTQNAKLTNKADNDIKFKRNQQLQSLALESKTILLQWLSSRGSTSFRAPISNWQKQFEQRLQRQTAFLSQIEDQQVKQRLGEYYQHFARILQPQQLLENIQALQQLQVRNAEQEKQIKQAANGVHNLVAQLSEIGYRQIQSANKAANEAIQRGYYGFFAVANLLLLGLASSIWLLMRFHLLGRVQTMEQTITRLSKGDLTKPINVSSTDDFGELEQGLENLRQSVLQRQQLELQLRQQKDLLEDEVAERTKDLSDSNTLLEREATEHAMARRKAEDAVQTQANFLATMSHELRTPLSSIEGTSTLLSETALNDSQKEYIRLIRLANSTLLELLEDLLSYAQLEAGQIRLHPSPFALCELIDNMLTIHSFRAHQKKLVLTRAIDDDIPEWLLGDSRKINQIILNLVGNAIKFTDEGSVNLSVQILPSSQQDKQITLQFKVEDTGIGFDSHEATRVFDAFYQVQHQHSRRHGGAGLGLAICQRLVNAMHGDIHIHSQPKKGTTVIFTLPLVLAENGQPVQVLDEETENLPEVLEQPLKLLIVEDDDINRIVCEKYLDGQGHDIISVASAQQARQYISPDIDFDTILMDVNLDGESGLDLAVEFNNMAGNSVQHLPIILMSAHVLESQASAMQLAGMAGFLYKPFSRKQLLAAIQVALDDNHKAPIINVVQQDQESLFDQQYLAEELHCLGQDGVEEILAAFMSISPDLLSRLSTGLDTTPLDTKAMAQTAHRLKGSAGNLGMSALINCINELELLLARQAPQQSLSLNIKQVNDLYQQSCHAVQNWLQAKT